MHTIVRGGQLAASPSGTITFEGEGYGSAVSFFLVDNEPGAGPDLHKHPYPETWIIRSGTARVTVDGEEVEAGPATPPVASNNPGSIGVTRRRRCARARVSADREKPPRPTAGNPRQTVFAYFRGFWRGASAAAICHWLHPRGSIRNAHPTESGSTPSVERTPRGSRRADATGRDTG